MPANSKIFSTISIAKKTLIKNIFYMFSLKGVDLLIPLIVTPYLVRVVGIEKFGLISFSLSYSMFFSAFVNYGFDITASRDIAKSRENKSLVEVLYSQNQYSILLLTAACFCFSVILIWSVPTLYEEKWLFLSAVGLTITQAAFPTWMFLGLERMGFIAVLGALSKLAYLTTLLLVVKNESDYIYANLIYALSSLLSLVGALAVIRFHLRIKFQRPRVNAIKATLRGGFRVFLMQVSPVLYNNSSTFLLGMTASPSAVGVYAAAQKIIEVCVAMSNLLARTFLPYIAIDIRRHEFFSKVMIGVGFCITISLVFLSGIISDILYGEIGEQVSIYLRVMSIGIFFVFLYLTYGMNYLPVTGNDRVAAKISVCVSVVGLVFSILVIPTYGVTGAVGVIVLSRAGLAIWSILEYRRIHYVND